MLVVKQAISLTECNVVWIQTIAHDVEHGVGLRELRVRGEAGNFRVIYIAALADAV